MNGFDGFGGRIHALRKARGMTQEDLAGRLGVTPQAVSKWENENSYPDIALLPTIAGILGVDIGHLFGARAQAQPTAPGLPAHYQGLPLVHRFQQVGCYSDKAVRSVEGSGVRFEDGSVAELSNRLVTNMGVGEIRTLALDGGEALDEVDFTQTEADFEFGPTDSLRVAVLANSTGLRRSPDGRTRVHAKGHPRFIRRLKADVEGTTLVIAFEQEEGDAQNSDWGNALIIDVPYDRGEVLGVTVNGSGSFDGDAFPFAQGELHVNGQGSLSTGSMDTLALTINGSGSLRTGKSNASTLRINGSGSLWAEGLGDTNMVINGSGDVHAARAASLTAAINGSGSMDIHAVEGGDTSVRINGSGDVTVRTVSGGDVTVRISGSGDVLLGEGACGRFDVHNRGIGTVNAQGITADTASIILEKDGEVVLGRVRGVSTEQIQRKGSIRVLARGEG